MTIQVDKVLDAKGLACPLPIVRTKKALEELAHGCVLEVQATDKGSLADLQSWAKSTGHHYLGTKQAGNVLHHFIRKSAPAEAKDERDFPNTITNEELEQRIKETPPVTIVDVREPAEYAFAKISGAISIPLGQLEQRIQELNQEDEICVICRTGKRSDMAAQLLHEKGFKHVKNVVPGMSAWKGTVEQSNHLVQ
ncbi:sulfurtransferase TusA family protein [Paenibacillus sp. 481]|uniref:sulfurtransferase TusA family protein n=1 Tax=Paenibacillus sp. 481 TaxID=2835869 RepID=UPI001E324042|nr:sulfurtransferase TusA family protein [Paenibacillus sp. 481]UHA71921.1 sulfurtransferase TusA family protein [Paenibacillus sp. 481]